MKTAARRPDPAGFFARCKNVDALTFSLDLGCAYWLASLGARIAAVCDPARFRPWFPEAGRQCGRVAVRPGGKGRLFHPKVWRGQGGPGGREWMVSSANISLGESTTQRNFFVSLTGMSRGGAIETNTFFETLKQGQPTCLWVDIGNRSIRALGGPLLKAVIEWLGSQGADSAVIASPIRASRNVLEELLKKGVRNFTIFCRKDQTAAPSKGFPAKFYVPGGKEGLHGKLFFIQRGNEAFLYVGSANFTQAAWGHPDSKRKNVEGGVAFIGRAEELAPIVGTLLEGKWRRAEPGVDRSEPGPEEEDEWWSQEDEAEVRKAAAHIHVGSGKIRIKGYRGLTKLQLCNRETQNVLESVTKSPWQLNRVKADALKLEVLLHRGDSLVRVWLAAVVFDDSDAEHGEHCSLQDIFAERGGGGSSRKSRGGSRRRRRSRSRKRLDGEDKSSDVRFPWSRIERLRSYVHPLGEAEFKRQLEGLDSVGSESEPPSSQQELRAHIRKEVVRSIRRQAR